MMTVPGGSKVAVYELGIWRWKEMRHQLQKMIEAGATHMQVVECGGVFKRNFVVIARSADIMTINYMMRVNDVPPTLAVEKKVIAAAVLIACLGFSSLGWAGDREHVGGRTSPANRAEAKDRARAEMDIAREAGAIDDCGCINYDKLGRYYEKTKIANPTVYSLNTKAGFWTGWGPYSIFSREFWSNPRSSISYNTPYDGGGARDGITGGPGIGSWGQGGGTGPGARGY